ncbi:MAG: AMIN domain-containing protein [Leptolyngbyaceae cyanobacterium SM2_3_12]|nr:AMIN domain-containing protein [Leptolyngbyaceae cyanobacterium SM2_3_12]
MQPFIQPNHASRRLGGWLGGGLMVSTLLMISPAASAAVLSAWQFDPTTQAFTVTLPSGVVPQYTIAAEPARIILTIPQTQLGEGATEQRYGGAVSRVELSQPNPETLQVVLELAPGTVLEPGQAQLVSIPAGEQTRWVLTPLIAQAGTTAGMTAPNSPSDQEAGALQTPSASDQMIVELPIIPAANGHLGFPEAGAGRLSTSAANLMLQEDIDNLTNLPETLSIDPFNIGLASGEQISVPSLDELDAAVGPVATVPPLPAPTVTAEPSGNTAEVGGAVPPSGNETASAPITVQVPEPAAPATANDRPDQVALTLEPPSLETARSNPQAGQTAPLFLSHLRRLSLSWLLSLNPRLPCP